MHPSSPCAQLFFYCSSLLLPTLPSSYSCSSTAASAKTDCATPEQDCYCSCSCWRSSRCSSRSSSSSPPAPLSFCLSHCTRSCATTTARTRSWSRSRTIYTKEAASWARPGQLLCELSRPLHPPPSLPRQGIIIKIIKPKNKEKYYLYYTKMSCRKSRVKRQKKSN